MTVQWRRRAAWPSSRPGARLATALAFGVGSLLLSYALLKLRGYGAGDLTWQLGGAEALLKGVNPYQNPEFGPGRPYPYGDPLFYPLPAVLAVVPLTGLDPYVAGAVFFGICSALLAYAAFDRPALLPAFASAPFFVAATVAQWSPLVLAAAALPWLMPVAIAKPNLFLPAAAFGRSGRGALIATLAVLLFSLIFLPSWPLDWIANLRGQHHLPAILTAPGLLLAPGVVLVRRREVRLILLLAMIPQLLFWYDQLLLWLVPRTMRQSALLSAGSWAGYLAWMAVHPNEGMNLLVAHAAPWVVCSTFLPALGVALWQAFDERQRARPATHQATANEETAIPRAA